MSRLIATSWYWLALAGFICPARGDDPPAVLNNAGAVSRVYGEWRIRVRPDQGPAYEKLIAESGLPLFREAGGRMVGWWKTLIGNLYEHVTIWEYGDMAAFERAIGLLSKNTAFARFVAARDPLLVGEENRFLRLVPGAIGPPMPMSAAVVVHEVHRVVAADRDEYLDFMTRDGLRLLKANGFRPVGPWVVEVGRMTEVTYLFGYESLAERARLKAKFAATAAGKDFDEQLSEVVEEMTTRVLVPAPFAARAPAGDAAPKADTSAILPHGEQLAPGVFAAGFAQRYHSTNCGWVALGEETLLIDLPRGIPAPEFLALAAASTGKPARTLVLTAARDGDGPIVRSLLEGGIRRVLTSVETHEELLAAPGSLDPARLHTAAERTTIGDKEVAVEFVPFDQVAGSSGAAVYVPAKGVLFAGPLVVHGPRAALAGSNTGLWVDALRRLEALKPARVVPGAGSWGSPELLVRERQFLTELRRQVGYHIAQGRPLAGLGKEVSLPAGDLVWMPYDTPTAEDIEHVYRELTVPNAPFQGRTDFVADARPHALVLIGDLPHEPGHLEEGLRPVFEATSVVPHFTVDVKALSAQNLAMVKLLVILRDGLQRPERDNRTHFMWMTPEQERAIAAFVEGGGGFLNLHNAMGLYPPGGAYLDLVGGRYIGHGPLERFRVEVVDPAHPITRGVTAFFVADEQHTPPFDQRRVHLLLRNRSDEGKTAAAGWVREPGRGRLCHLANGHTREALAHPMYQKLLCNAVRWCLRLEDAASQSQSVSSISANQ
jgi:type 1 glutamine amidotransferase